MQDNIAIRILAHILYLAIDDKDTAHIVIINKAMAYAVKHKRLFSCLPGRLLLICGSGFCRGSGIRLAFCSRCWLCTVISK